MTITYIPTPTFAGQIVAGSNGINYVVESLIPLALEPEDIDLDTTVLTLGVLAGNLVLTDSAAATASVAQSDIVAGVDPTVLDWASLTPAAAATIASVLPDDAINPDDIDFSTISATDADAIVGALTGDAIDPSKVDWGSLSPADIATIQGSINSDTFATLSGQTITFADTSTLVVPTGSSYNAATKVVTLSDTNTIDLSKLITSSTPTTLTYADGTTETIGGNTSVFTNNGDATFTHSDGDGTSVTVDMAALVSANVTAGEADAIIASSSNDNISPAKIDWNSTTTVDANTLATNMGNDAIAADKVDFSTISATDANAILSTATPYSMDDLSDADTTGLVSGQVMQFDGSNFVPVTPAAGNTSTYTDNGNGTVTHDDGTGTTTTIDLPASVSANISATEANTLIAASSNDNIAPTKIDFASINATDANSILAAATGGINTLSDVDTTGITSGQVLQYDGTDFVAATVSAGGNTSIFTDNADGTITHQNGGGTTVNVDMSARVAASVTLAEANSIVGTATGVNSLADVDTTGLVSGQVLEYDGTNFVPATVTGTTSSTVRLADGTIQHSDGATVPVTFDIVRNGRVADMATLLTLDPNPANGTPQITSLWLTADEFGVVNKDLTDDANVGDWAWVQDTGDGGNTLPSILEARGGASASATSTSSSELFLLASGDFTVFDFITSTYVAGEFTIGAGESGIYEFSYSVEAGGPATTWRVIADIKVDRGGGYFTEALSYDSGDGVGTSATRIAYISKTFKLEEGDKVAIFGRGDRVGGGSVGINCYYPTIIRTR